MRTSLWKACWQRKTTWLHADESLWGQSTLGDSYREISARSATKPNGKKRILWWNRQFAEGGKTILRFLRTSHPERQNKEGFVSAIVEWIKNFHGQATREAVATL